MVVDVGSEEDGDADDGVNDGEPDGTGCNVIVGVKVNNVELGDNVPVGAGVSSYMTKPRAIGRGGWN